MEYIQITDVDVTSMLLFRSYTASPLDRLRARSTRILSPSIESNRIELPDEDMSWLLTLMTSGEEGIGDVTSLDSGAPQHCDTSRYSVFVTPHVEMADEEVIPRTRRTAQ